MDRSWWSIPHDTIPCISHRSSLDSAIGTADTFGRRSSQLIRSGPMQELRRLAWSAALAFAATSPALAQTTGGNIGSPATQSAAIGNTTTGTTTTASNTTGASSSPTGATSTAQSTYKAAPTFPAPSSTTGNTNSAIAASNF